MKNQLFLLTYTAQNKRYFIKFDHFEGQTFFLLGKRRDNEEENITFLNLWNPCNNVIITMKEQEVQEKKFFFGR